MSHTATTPVDHVHLPRVLEQRTRNSVAAPEVTQERGMRPQKLQETVKSSVSRQQKCCIFPVCLSLDWSRPFPAQLFRFDRHLYRLSRDSTAWTPCAQRLPSGPTASSGSKQCFVSRTLRCATKQEPST